MAPNFQGDVKIKIQAVREIVKQVSSNDIGLVLQHFDYNIELTVAAFLDGGASGIIDQWKKTSVKQGRAKRSTKKSLNADSTQVVPSQDLGKSAGLEDKVCDSSYGTRPWDQCSSEESTTLSVDSASDSRSVTSDSAATGSSSSDQALDSGCETTAVPASGRPVVNGSHLGNESTKKIISAHVRKVPTSSAASLIESAFNQLRARIDEREADLLLQLNTEYERTYTESIFICHINDMLHNIERFGQLQTKVQVDVKPCTIISNTAEETSIERQACFHPNINDSICELPTEEGKYEFKVIKDEEHIHPTQLLHSTEPFDQSNQTKDANTSVKISKGKKSQNKKSRRRNLRNTSAESSSVESHPTSSDTLTTTKLKAVSKKKSSKDLLTDHSAGESSQVLQTNETSLAPHKDTAFGAYVFNQSDSLTQYEMLHLQNTQGTTTSATSGTIKSNDNVTRSSAVIR